MYQKRPQVTNKPNNKRKNSRNEDKHIHTKDQVGIIPGIQGQSNIRKSTNKFILLMN